MIIEEEVYLNHLREEVVDDFLEHFGVRGMKWGVKNIREQRKNATPEQRKAGRRKFARNLAIGVGGGVAVGLGAAFMINRSHSMKKLRDIRNAKQISDGVAWRMSHQKALQVPYPNMQEMRKLMSSPNPDVNFREIERKLTSLGRRIQPLR